MGDAAAVQRRLGERVAAARIDASLTQTALAERVGMERTQLVRVEAGERKVTVTELAAIAAHFGLSIDWFVTDPPLAVTSRRSDGASAHASSQALDLAVDRAARDIRFLWDIGAFVDRPIDALPIPSSYEEAEALAAEVRRQLGLADEPIDDLGAAAERLGLVWYSEDLGLRAGDGACIEVPGPAGGRLGVAVINGTHEPGRRRWTLAHELGHFLMGDAYATEHPGGDVEKMIDAFVVHFLMPRGGVEHLWRELEHDGLRRVALGLAARYKTSWSAACNQLCNLNHISPQQRKQLCGAPPTRGDYLATGEEWSEELRAPAVPPHYTKAVLGCYAAGDLTASRTLALLRETLEPENLPSVRLEEQYPHLPSP